MSHNGEPGRKPRPSSNARARSSSATIDVRIGSRDLAIVALAFAPGEEHAADRIQIVGDRGPPQSTENGSPVSGSQMPWAKPTTPSRSRNEHGVTGQVD